MARVVSFQTRQMLTVPPPRSKAARVAPAPLDVAPPLSEVLRVMRELYRVAPGCTDVLVNAAKILIDRASEREGA